jgi:hypothetical protein
MVLCWNAAFSPLEYFLLQLENVNTMGRMIFQIIVFFYCTKINIVVELSSLTGEPKLCPISCAIVT